MSNTHSTSLFTMGTTVWDQVRRLPGRFAEISGQKPIAKFGYEHAGGSAPNTALAFEAIAGAFGLKSEIHLCSKFGADGPQNRHKPKIMRDVGHMNLMDACEGVDEYRIQGVFVIVDDDNRTAIKEFDDILNTPFNPTITAEIEYAVSQSNIVVLHSRYPHLSEVAARKAKECGIPVVLDFSDKDPNITSRLENVIRLSDYILAADDALLPDMTEANPNELRQKLVEQSDAEFVAVSNSHHPVMCHINGKDGKSKQYGKIKIEQADNIDNLGAGDVRDAAFAYFIDRNNGPVDALRKANVITANFIGFPGREEWKEQLEFFVGSHPAFHERDFISRPLTYDYDASQHPG